MSFSDRQVSSFEVERIEPVGGGWAVTLYARLHPQAGDSAGPSAETTVVVPKSGQSIDDVVADAVHLALSFHRRLAAFDPDDLSNLALTDR